VLGPFFRLVDIRTELNVVATSNIVKQVSEGKAKLIADGNLAVGQASKIHLIRETP
jgi:hypothetical protein